MLQLFLNVLADFGLAQKLASKSYLHAAGTQNYSAPETEQNKMTTESDVWSIGVIIIEVITGIHPFQGLTQQQTLTNIANGKYKAFPDYIQGELRMMLEAMISWDYKKRPTVKSLLQTETMQLVRMIEKSKQQKESEQEKEQMNKRMNELEMKVRSLEVEKESEKQKKIKEKRDKEKAMAEKDQEKRRADSAVTEKDRLQVELNRERTEKYQEKRRADSAQVELIRERTEKDQEKRRADLAVSDKDRLQVELNRAFTQKDQEKQRANNAEELTRIFQSQVETTQSEVTRLSSEVRRLNQVLQIRETVPSTPKAQLKQTPLPAPKPKQSLMKVTSSAQAITVNLQVPSGMHGYKDANSFIHDNSRTFCTISTETIISEGIVYYESVFEKHDENSVFGIGIADSSVVFKPNKGPSADGNKGKTVIYWSHGDLYHINFGPYNQGFRCEQRIGAEVNMICRPRRLMFFVEDVEQENYIVNIPEAIRFWSYILAPNSSFTVTRFERRSSSSAHGVTGSIALDWGKEWPKEDDSDESDV
ncbi:MAG: hypothetical protein EZS28_021646 [Streblomastix strix]|uniref:Protein kinase domain-containing protein n=1 Tax=Streblomastix strix TaxID=222440 RepID=A0A5J4VJM6_9EUKA|nr:MAG: hypothetical protein EZS28_021646 [Streblomastix strix]